MSHSGSNLDMSENNIISISLLLLFKVYEIELGDKNQLKVGHLVLL